MFADEQRHHPYLRPVEHIPLTMAQPERVKERFRIRNYMTDGTHGLRFPQSTNIKMERELPELIHSMLGRGDLFEVEGEPGKLYVDIDCMDRALTEFGKHFDEFREIKRAGIQTQRKKRKEALKNAFGVLSSYIQERLPPPSQQVVPDASDGGSSTAEEKKVVVDASKRVTVTVRNAKEQKHTDDEVDKDDDDDDDFERRLRDDQFFFDEEDYGSDDDDLFNGFSRKL
jgi:hypothetical protein